MRLLTKAEQDRIIETLYQKVSQEYPFYLPKDGIQVISGKLEGQLCVCIVDVCVLTDDLWTIEKLPLTAHP